jgi:hypothetical protein
MRCPTAANLVMHRLERTGLLNAFRYKSGHVELGDNRLESTLAHFRTLVPHKGELVLQRNCRVGRTRLVVRQMGASIHDSPVLLCVVAMMVP